PTLVWDFGDGGAALEGVPMPPSGDATHVFLNDGDYTVTCGVSFTNGIAGLATVTVLVANERPDVQIENGNIQIPLGGTPVLVARAFDPGIQDRHRFHWDFDNDGTTDFDGGFVAVPTFNTPGTFTVKVTAEDFDGGVKDDTIQVEVGSGTSVPVPIEILPPNPPLVVPGPPHLLVHVSGQHYGLTDGVSIENDDLTIFTMVEELLSNPSFGTAAGIVGKVLAGAARTLATMRGDDASKENVYLSVFRNFKAGSGFIMDRTTIHADGGDNILNMNLLYSEGGVPQKLISLAGFMPFLSTAHVQFDWNTKEVSISGTALPPGAPGPVPLNVNFQPTVLSNSASADRSGPSLALVQNLRTDRIFIVGRDNFSPEASLTYFIGEDADGDGSFAGENFFQLTNHHFLEIAAPSHRYLVVAVDQAGNVSDLTMCRPGRSFDVDFAHTPIGAPPQTYEKPFCDALEDIRGAVRAAIAEGLVSGGVRDFLVHENDIWFFEQGSGACLWKGSTSCDGCEGVYKPGKSDNDYELFMPVYKTRAFTNRTEFIEADPNAIENMEGDWYFKPPEGLDGGGNPVTEVFVSGGVNPLILSWRYTMPGSLTNASGLSVVTKTRPSSPTADPANPFFFPITPAQAIAFFFTRTVTENSSHRQLLPEVSFFPFRREHFEFAVMSLEKPPPFGDDPVGDAGMGRHLLLLKWLLEGEYVDLPTPLNDNIKDLNLIFSELASSASNPNGIPLADGFEWGVYQDWAALKSGARLRVDRVDSNPAPAGFDCKPNDSFRKEDEKIIKKVGKAAIRAALARLAGDPTLRASLVAMTPAQYDSQGFPSFEHYIGFLTTNSPGAGLFGPDVSLIPGFLQAKVADEAFMGELIENGEVAQFTQDAFRFMRNVVQSPTRTTYNQYLAGLRSQGNVSEEAARRLNLTQIEFGFDAGGKPVPGRRHLLGEDGGTDIVRPLTVTVHNRGSNTTSS
ncbi:MAG TPA: PKD domain-containing protein, partial [Verrucomicrobiae bacterium]|nr:PKD domain-containing protein [Verrucomicrobiae bacterium]